MIAHPEEFFDLMGLHLPVPEHHKHYLEMLLKQDQFLSYSINNYNHKYLPWCSENGYSSPNAYREDEALPMFLKWAKDSCTLDSLVLMEKSKYQFAPVDKTNQFRGELLLSIGMIHPDFSVMKLVAFQREVDLPEDWEALCERLGIHSFLGKSEVFMRECFAAYEPEKAKALQEHIIAKLLHHLAVPDNELVSVSTSEIVIKFPEKGMADLLVRVNDIIGRSSCIRIKMTPFRDNPVYDVIIKKFGDSDLQGKLKALREEKMEVVKNQRYEEAAKIREKEKEIIEVLGKHYDAQLGEQCILENINPLYWVRTEYAMQQGKLSETKKLLVNVPDRKFYLYFRTMVLREPLEQEDLLFIQDGTVAKWVIPEILE